MILGLEPVTLIQRRGERDPATGRMDVSETRVSTMASIQPAEGANVERVPEGFRIEDVRILYMYRNNVVKAGDVERGLLADHIEWTENGQLERWEVQTVPDWRMILPHYELVVTRIKEVEEEA